MDADLIVGILVHQPDPVASSEHVEEEHDEEELHQGVLICIQEAKAVNERNLSIEDQMSRIAVECLRRDQEPVVILLGIIVAENSVYELVDIVIYA